MQVPLIVIDVNNEEVHQLLWPIQSMDLDMNKLYAMDLVDLQHIATQWQKYLIEGYVQSQNTAEKI